MPRDEVLIVAGDFNDWGDKLDAPMAAAGLSARDRRGRSAGALQHLPVAHARSSRWTASTRAGCAASRRSVPRGAAWARMSDHLPLVAELELRLTAVHADPSAAPATDTLTLLKGGVELFPAMVEAIDAARSEVLLETYIFEFSGAPLAVAEALERAAAARRQRARRRRRRRHRRHPAPNGRSAGRPPGCTGASSIRRKRLARALAPGAGGACIASSAWSTVPSRSAAASTCSTIYFDPNYGVARPAALRLRGPRRRPAGRRRPRHHDPALAAPPGRRARRAQHDLEGALQAARAATGARHGHGRRRQRAADRARAARSPRWCCATTSASARRIEGTYRLAIAQAKREILIANAYFVPGVRLQRALLRAARRGVRITLLLQGRYEYFMQHHASRAVYGVLLQAPASRSSSTSRASCTPRSRRWTASSARWRRSARRISIR